VAYSYDSLNRLTEAKQSSGGSTDDKYTYDSDSNLTQQNLTGSITTAAYNTADQVCWTLTTTSANTCTSPQRGRHLHLRHHRPREPHGHQRRVRRGLQHQKPGHLHDQPHRRRRPVDDLHRGGVQRTHRSRLHQLHQRRRTTPSSTTSGTTTYYTREPTGQLTSLTVSANTYYYLYDGAGNVIGLVNATGTRVATYSYDPTATPPPPAPSPTLPIQSWLHRPHQLHQIRHPLLQPRPRRLDPTRPHRPNPDTTTPAAIPSTK